MKKFIANAICLSMLLTCGALVGCKDEAETPQTPETTNEKLGVETAGGTLMNGFEVFDRDVQLIKVFNEFGRLEQNTDEKYVRSGESSLHVQPFGGRIKQNTANPFFLLPTTSTRFPELGFGNFTNVDTVTFWAYNAEEEPLNVGIGFQAGKIKAVGGNPSYDIVKTTWSEYYSLQPGWNFVEYEVLPAELALHGVAIDGVQGVAFEFDYVWSNDFADAPDLYIDEVCLNYLETAKTGELDIPVAKTTWKDGETERDRWMIFDFESGNASRYFYYAHDFPAPMAGEPVMKHVFAGDYGAIAGDNAQTMLWLLKHGGKQKGECPVVFMYGEVMQAAFAAIGQDILDHPENYAFRFDAYNASAVTQSISLEFSGSKVADYHAAYKIPAGEWLTYSVDFGFVNKYAKDKEAVYTENVGNVRFAWGDFSQSANIEDRPILFDNFRIDKIA